MFINRKTTQIIALVCALCFLCTSVFAQTQSVAPITTTQKSSDVVYAQSDAKRDALTETNGTVWFGVGCLLGLIGWIIAACVDSNPPAVRLIGKSPEYVAYYSDAYKREAHHIKTRKAITGCVVGSLVSIVLQVVLMASSSSNQ